MKITFVNQPYFPDHVATAQILQDMCEGLVENGYQVSVICSNHQYDGSRSYASEPPEHNGVVIHRVKCLPVGKNRSVLLRAIGFLSFYFSSFCKALFISKPDIIVSLTTPPFIGWVMGIVCRMRNIKHIHWCMDVMPDGMVVSGMIKENGLLHRVFSKMNRSFLPRCNKVCGLGSYMIERLKAYGVKDEQSAVIPVWADKNKVYPVRPEDNWFLDKYSLRNKFIVMHSGNMSKGSCFDSLVSAMEELSIYEDIVFVFIGGGERAKELKSEFENRQQRNYLFLPFQKQEDLPFSLSAADVHIVTIMKGVEGVRVPCKIYGIIAVGKPTIYIGGVESEIGDIIQSDRLGYVIDQTDYKSLINNILELRASNDISQDIFERSSSLFSEKYDKTVCVQKFIDILIGLQNEKS